MTYWLLTTEYPPFYGGGIGTYCHYTANMLAAAGCQVTVFVADDKIRDRDEIHGGEGIRIIRFNSDRNNLSDALGYTARLSYAFADVVKTVILEDGKPDFIEAQDYLGIAYYLAQYKHLGYPFMQDIPILLTLHSPAFIYLDYNRVPLYRFPDFWTCEMEKQAIKSADHLISPTRFLLREIGQHIDISDRPVSIMPNPFKPDVPPVDSPVHIPGKIIYYGKLSPQKGSFELMEYFTELWDAGFPYPLHIVGGTDIVFHPEQRTMGQLIQDRYKAYQDRGMLILQGKIQPKRIKDTLQYAHLVIVPSIVDNMPYVVIEAMSLGKVVLASVQGGQSEIIEEGETGFLFDHRDPPSFARQIQKILALPVEEIQRIGANASRKIHAAYGFDVIGPQKLALLGQIGSSRRGRHHSDLSDQRSPVPSKNHYSPVASDHCSPVPSENHYSPVPSDHCPPDSSGNNYPPVPSENDCPSDSSENNYSPVPSENHCPPIPPDNHFPFLYQEPVSPLPAEPVTISSLTADPLPISSLTADAVSISSLSSDLNPISSLPSDPAPNRLLSVVIPYYNMGRYIDECLHSVLDSTYRDLEVIIVDDGSTDSASIRWLEDFSSDPRVTIIRQRNRGLALTRNYGAEIARGTYLAFLDADDKVASTYYEKAIRALQRNDNVFFAGSWVQYFGDSRRLWPTFTPQPPYALVHNPVNSSSLVYKRAAFLAGGLNDKKTDYGLEDYDSVISMLRHGFNGVVIPEPLFHYRVRKGSMFRQATQEKLLYSCRYIAEKNRDYYTRFATQVINILNANGPGYQFDNPTISVRPSTIVQHESRLVRHLKSAVKKSPGLKRLALAIKHKLNF